jgi:FkbM family methyltransferase
MSLKATIAKNFPFLGKYKRFLKALKDTMSSKKAYAQHGEDVFFEDYINKNKIDVSKFEYIDVGANHPTDISNTYLLYRKGMRGIIIEPNNELIKLFNLFRKQDKTLEIGVSNTNTVLKFFISKTPVISSFKQEWMNSEVMKSCYVPILTLDNAVEHVIEKPVFLLSIDVEGLNKEVLEGATSTIAKCLLLCLEYDDDVQKEQFIKMVGNDFELLTTLSCNLIFENKKQKQSLLNK